MDEIDVKHETRQPDTGRTASSADNPWVVLACLFLAAGALGIPLIWAGRAFSKPVKVLLTVLVTAYTALMLWLIWIALVAFYRHVVHTL